MQAVRCELARGAIAVEVYRRSQKAGALGGVLGRVVSEVVVAEWQWPWYAGAPLPCWRWMEDAENKHRTFVSGTDLRIRQG
jgi:hypothetical protein